MRLSRFTPFPNVILDDVMPHLGDTELRVLAVIVRQTIGWQQNRKWLSHSWIKRCTGRQGAAVSRAIDLLVKRGLVVVQDATGRRVHAATERRRSQSKLSYSVHHLLLYSEHYRRRIGFGLEKRTSQSELHKAKTTKERKRKESTAIKGQLDG